MISGYPLLLYHANILFPNRFLKTFCLMCPVFLIIFEDLKIVRITSSPFTRYSGPVFVFNFFTPDSMLLTYSSLLKWALSLKIILWETRYFFAFFFQDPNQKHSMRLPWCLVLILESTVSYNLYLRIFLWILCSIF